MTHVEGWNVQAAFAPQLVNDLLTTQKVTRPVTASPNISLWWFSRYLVMPPFLCSSRTMAGLRPVELRSGRRHRGVGLRLSRRRPLHGTNGERGTHRHSSNATAACPVHTDATPTPAAPMTCPSPHGPLADTFTSIPARCIRIASWYKYVSAYKVLGSGELSFIFERLLRASAEARVRARTCVANNTP